MKDINLLKIKCFVHLHYGNKMIKWISNKPYAAFVFLIFSAVIITLSLSFNFLCNNVFPNSSMGIYDKNFWVNLLVNLNSSIIDFLFLGLVILYIDKKIQKEKDNNNHQKMIQERIEILRRDLKDYAEHSTIELDLRKAGIVRDLCKLNENKIDVRKIQIHEVALRDIDLIGLSLYRSKLEKLSFKKCTLRSLNLMEGNSKKLSFCDCTIRNMKLNNGSFKAIEFKNCSLVNSKMNNAELNSAIFINCDLQDVTFENSNLRSANFKGSINIDVEQLIKAACLDYIIADEDILSKVKVLRNDVTGRRGIEHPSRTPSDTLSTSSV